MFGIVDLYTSVLFVQYYNKALRVFGFFLVKRRTASFSSFYPTFDLANSCIILHLLYLLFKFDFVFAQIKQIITSSISNGGGSSEVSKMVSEIKEVGFLKRATKQKLELDKQKQRSDCFQPFQNQKLKQIGYCPYKNVGSKPNFRDNASLIFVL